MCDSVCRWRIVKTVKYFEVMLNIFEFWRVLKNLEFDRYNLYVSSQNCLIKVFCIQYSREKSFRNQVTRI